MSRVLKTVPILFIVFFLVVSCSGEKKAVVEYIDQTLPIIEEFEDALELGFNTSRMNLPAVIKDMQAAKRKWDALEAPEPAEDFKESMSLSMQYNIDAFFAFMSEEDDSVIQKAMEQANDHMEDAATEMVTLQSIYSD